MLGVDVQTLRAWEKSGELIPDRRSKGGVRYYDIGKVMGLGNEDMPTIGYARVSASRSCWKHSVQPKAGATK
jgi:putative resolvase